MGDTAADIDCTFDADGGDQRPARGALERIRARPRTRCAAAREHVILTDEAVGAERAPIPMILATGAVHTHI